MDGINKITERIAVEAREEISAMQAETTEKCRSIKEAYDKAAQEEYWKMINAGVKDCELQVKRLGSTATMESKKNILSMKQGAGADVFDKAVDRLCTLPEDKYVDFLASLAASAASTGLEELVFNARDKYGCAKAVTKAANELLKKRGLYPKLTISELTGNFKGGLMVKQGDIEMNCTIEKLVELSRSELAPKVAELLFAE